MALLLTSCAAFHPRHKEGPATAAQAGDVSVQFVGISAFPQSELQDALTDAFDEIKSEGLNSATADDASFFLELYYRKNGYAFVETSYKIGNSRQLILTIKEGPLVNLGDITITGNDHYKDPTSFQQYIIGQTRERFPSSTKVYPYVEADVQKGTELIQRFYLAEGYLNAQVSPPVVAYTADRTKASINIAVVEGSQYHFDRVEIAGQLVFPAAKIRGLIAPQSELPYTKPRVDEMQRKLQDYYKKKGYYTALVTATSDPLLADAGNRVATSFLVEPGPLFHFDGTRITGTDRLKPAFLRNRFRKLTGEVYDPAKLDEVYQQMIRTGLFSLLRVEPVIQPDHTLRLDIGVKEAKARELGFSIGFGTFEGAIAGFEVRDRDFMGTGRPLSFSVDYSTRTLSGEILYLDPYLFETDNQLRLRLSALRRDLDAYKKTEISGLAEIVRPLTKQLRVSAFVLSKKADITEFTIDPVNVGKQSYKTNSVGMTASLDLRDNPVSPTKGLVTNLSVDVASDIFGGDLNFLRSTYRVTYFQPIGKNMTLLAGFRAGVVAPFNGSDGTTPVDNDKDPKTPGVPRGSTFPIDERFFSGGSTSVRSFAERELGPYDKGSGEAIGGQAFTIFNVEYVFPLAAIADLRGAVFVDAGNLRTRYQDFGLDDERYAVGAGLRYNLPIGPLRLDYGVNPNPHRNESFGAFQFSFGYAF